MATPLRAIVVISMAALTISTTTAIPPPQPTTTPPEPTTPKGCVDYNGKVIEGLVPGGHWKSKSGCMGCHCDNDWKAMCYVQDCWVTPCVDSIRKPGVCCAICPNGNNCKTPSGKIVKDGEYLMDGSMNCSCTAQSFTKGSEPQAECSISLPLGCRLDNGTVLEGVKPGDSYKTDPCTTCYCQKDGKMMCASMMCALPYCGPNGHYTREGDCCPRCREGPSGCTLPNGTIAKDLKPGDKYQMGPCTTCICQEMSFQMACMSMACAMPFCGDRGSYTPKGMCCPVCRPCEDANFACRFWASRGECTNNPGWMLKNCKKSCKVKECQSECVDADPYCNWWSGQEQCEKNPVWMLNKCTKSCNACFPKNA
ncbi:cysteine-rich motor neuron 1 protein-like [Littorina saxatilis]|uniref:cysteine-rich motor neuron 1 protein-like n=1 Tax=Littorina saxatilis TaxID=31220 RepID=UPI0038B61D90